jgi:preflagellin peptidase FlaK
MNQTVTAINIIAAFTVLAYCSWKDIKTRQVANKTWLIYAPTALLLGLTQTHISNSIQLQHYAINIAIVTVVALLLFYTDTFGGADAKALICLALAFPTAPITPLIQQPPNLDTPFTISVLCNSALIAAISYLSYQLYNHLRHRKTDNTNGQPMMLYFTIGLLATATLGNLTTAIINAIIN